MFEERIMRSAERVRTHITKGDEERIEEYEHPSPTQATVPVDGLIAGLRSVVEGRVCEVDEVSDNGRPSLAVLVGDDSGTLKVVFGAGHGRDITPGQLIRAAGKPKQSGNRPIYMADPQYEILEAPRGD